MFDSALQTIFLINWSSAHIEQLDRKDGREWVHLNGKPISDKWIWIDKHIWFDHILRFGFIAKVDQDWGIICWDVESFAITTSAKNLSYFNIGGEVLINGFESINVVLDHEFKFANTSPPV